MSENLSKNVELQTQLSEILDEALKDFEDSGENTEQLTIPELHTSNADELLKEGYQDTMKSFVDSDQGELAASLQQMILDDGKSDIQSIIQESLKNLSDAKLNLPEKNDMTSMFANMSIKDLINSDKDMVPILMTCLQPFLNKESLYPVIKHLCDKYPKWLKDNELTSDKEKFINYARMFAFMMEIKDNLENQQDTDDEITKTRKFIELLEMLKKMQECGPPPDELIENTDDKSLIQKNSEQCNPM
ncbi:Pex19 protein [Cinara cedri]|uniref:Peroxin-19 n=1 Tax=Cinara cedri TaxID=506608 RepID=A0A5E4ND35_9HEMI|nr:Pex19 protein [Cinara cedri]VVC42778.1 Pex19 protein [Cinara cedri]